MSSAPSRQNTRFLGWLDHPRLAGLAYFATALTALFAAAALIFTALQLRTTAEQGRQQALLEREIAANASWERYMELASEHPDFAAGLPYATLDLKQKTAYLWFVERMLFAGEQILTFDPNDKQWKLAIEIEARIHQSYLESHDFLSESICSYTIALRRTLVAAFAKTNTSLSQKMAQRDRQCASQGYTE